MINIGSISGKRGSRNHVAYAAAKGGLFAFMRSLAKEAIPDDIRVNAVCPGRVATDIFGEQMTPAELERFLGEAPIGRLSSLRRWRRRSCSWPAMPARTSSARRWMWTGGCRWIEVQASSVRQTLTRS